MRTAILSVFLVVCAVFCQGRDDAKSKQAGEQSGQQQEEAKPKEAGPEVQSPKVTIPAGAAQAPSQAPSQGSEKSGTPTAQAPGTAAETDPSKMAAPRAAIPKGTPPGSDKTYVIGSEDVIRIQVWGNPTLSSDYIVRPDGKISLVLIGEIEVSGKTPEEVAEDVATKLKSGNFIKDPQVSVGVQQINSKKYYIQGEVIKPGAFPLIGPTTVLEALVNAGGFRDFANQKNIGIIRDGGKKIFKFNYKDVIKGKHLEQNILLQPGDQIVVK